MVRLFGRKQQQMDKKRLSPSVDWIRNAADTDEPQQQQQQQHQQQNTSNNNTNTSNSLMYQYALDEFAQTVAPGTSNDDGTTLPKTLILPLSAASTSSTTPVASNSFPTTTTTTPTVPTTPATWYTHPSILPSSLVTTLPRIGPDDDDVTDPRTPGAANAVQRPNNNNNRSRLDNINTNNTNRIMIMPDQSATYEEVYGEAYVGGTIKYIYPAGYQSMRPRSGPWKLSILVCLLFAWLSVFIVGHCSDQQQQNSASTAASDGTYNNNNYNSNNHNGYGSSSNANDESNTNNSDTDDDMSLRWCGSRPLYLLWVVAMLGSGVSAAYCSVIGYIKVRDFAVANGRSQPPGVAQGSSDYYLRIPDTHTTNNDMVPVSSSVSAAAEAARRSSHTDTASSAGTTSSHSLTYRPTIYQSDGTPQFWGAYIYRPTQAAVALTSR